MSYVIKIFLRTNQINCLLRQESSFFKTDPVFYVLCNYRNFSNTDRWYSPS